MQARGYSVIAFLVLALVALPVISAAGSAVVERHFGKVGSAPGDFLNKSIFPANNIWNTPVDTLPVDTRSSEYVNSIGASTGVHPDFGTYWAGSPIGFPFCIVNSSQPKVYINYTAYGDESDQGPFPVPPDAPVEGNGTGDAHVLVVDNDSWMLYELYHSSKNINDSWNADSGAAYNLDSNSLRPDGWTSADAAGLPIFSGLIRYDEVEAGKISHAIRFTAAQTQKAYVWPARHYASSITDPNVPPMGQRFRLKAGFDTSGYPAHVQVILQAMKKYGIILADNGADWFISGTHDDRWDDGVLGEIKKVKGSDFEAVNVSSLMIDPDSGEAKNPYIPEAWGAGGIAACAGISLVVLVAVEAAGKK